MYIGIVMKINNRIKKLIGTIIIPIWLIVFIGIVAIVAEILLPDLNGLMVFLFYLVSGLIWIIPIMPIISWMQRENQSNLPKVILFNRKIIKIKIDIAKIAIICNLFNSF